MPKKSMHRLAAEHTSPNCKTSATYHIVGYTLLAMMAIVMLSLSSAQSFWLDELEWTIGKVANKSFAEITTQLLEDGYNMPLYYYTLAILYPLVPFGEVYLCALSIIFVLIGIIFTRLAAREIGGERLGFTALCIASLSSVLMIQGGWEVRPYAFYFCFSALTLWLWFRRTKNENRRNITAFGIAMTFLLYSHWFGVVLLAFYGISDLFQIGRAHV